MRQGPHHSAHASTSTGIADEASRTSAANDVSVIVCGFESPPWALNDAPHLPQIGLCTDARNSLTRFLAPQFGQTSIAMALTQMLPEMLLNPLPRIFRGVGVVDLGTRVVEEGVVGVITNRFDR